METIATKRILRDIEMLRKNADLLAKQGIYFHITEDNIFQLYALIIPNHKHQDGLESPYTGGFFLFELTFPHTFPIEPPKIIFHPQQSAFRLHPNYYQNGKVCLSVINTWASADWSPSTSIMALLHILEERFTERALCFEPGCESSSYDDLKKYNDIVEYGKCVTTIFPILCKAHPLYTPFDQIICKFITENADMYRKRLEDVLIPSFHGKVLQTVHYNMKVSVDYKQVLDALEKRLHVVEDN